MTPQYVLSGRTEGDLELAAVQLLAALGYIVERPGEWESREDICRRLGVSIGHFKRRWQHRKFAPAIEVETGESGRLIRLRSCPAFDRWMQM